MADYIKREDALKIWVRNKDTSAEFASCVKAIPAADVVEVVRCEYCKYSRHWYFDKYLCDLWDKDGGVDVFRGGFCNYGRRRDDATD